MSLNPFKMNTGDRKLLAKGVHARARVVEFQPTTTVINDRRVVCRLTIEFETQEGRTVQADGKLPILFWNVDKWSVGDSLPICYDPKHPDKWTHGEEDASAASTDAPSYQAVASAGIPGAVFGGVQVVNASGDDPATVLSKLSRLRDQGLITDAQLEAAQHQLGGGAGAVGVQDPGAIGAQDSSVVGRLQQLDQLRNQSVISDAEYAAERQRILDSI